MIIGLNAGHTLSGYGSGAVGMLNESQETRRVVETITPMFQQLGCEIILCNVDKASSQGAYLAEVVKLANQQDLDWFISVHFNNDAAKKGQGVECYTYKGRQYADAVEVCEYISALGFKNRGVKEGTGLYVINKTKAKALLIEVCFVNEPDASTYKKMFDEICKAIVYAMAGYIAETPQTETQTEPQPPAQLPEKKKYVKVIVPELSVRKSLSWDGTAIAGIVKKNEVFTIAEGPIKVGNGSMYKLKSGLFVTAASKYVSVYEK